MHWNLSLKSFILDGNKIKLSKFQRVQRDGESDEIFPEMDPKFISPEILYGHQKFTLKSDIFSLGIIFYEIIFSLNPFTDTQLKNFE